MSQPNLYEIEIGGRTTDRVLRPVVDDFRIEVTAHGNTRLFGEIRDPSHLNGLLAHFTSMNVDIVELRRLSPTRPDHTQRHIDPTHPPKERQDTMTPTATTDLLIRWRERTIGTSSVAAAAVAAAGICIAFAGVQVALAAGAPIGEHVWGGTQASVLPPNMRVLAGGAAVVLTAMAAVIVHQAGLAGRPRRWLGPATWGIAGYLALNTMGNIASSSAVERLAFAPAAAIASALTAYVAFRTRRRCAGIPPSQPRRRHG